MGRKVWSQLHRIGYVHSVLWVYLSIRESFESTGVESKVSEYRKKDKVTPNTQQLINQPKHPEATRIYHHGYDSLNIHHYLVGTDPKSHGILPGPSGIGYSAVVVIGGPGCW